MVSFLCAVGFLGNFIVPKTIDSGPTIALPVALVIALILLGLAGIQSSLGPNRPGLSPSGAKREPG